MVETGVDVNSALGQSTKIANAAVIQMQLDFALASERLRERSVQDIELMTSQTKSIFEKLVDSLDTTFRAAMNKMVSETDEIDFSITILTEASALKDNKT